MKIIYVLRQVSVSVIILVVTLLLISCGTDANQEPGGNDEPPVEQKNNHNLAISISPDNAGTVEPSSGIFEEGSEVEINASANEGWVFNSWSGDVESENNPIVLSMDDDKSLIANFIDLRSDYKVGLTLKDNLGEVQLELGQKSDFSELLLQAPPPPPDGVLYAAFENNSEKYIRDYRPIVETDLKWELYINAGSGENLRLEWMIDESVMDGALLIRDELETFEIDMQASSALELEGIESNLLIIEYNNE